IKIFSTSGRKQNDKERSENTLYEFRILHYIEFYRSWNRLEGQFQVQPKTSNRRYRKVVIACTSDSCSCIQLRIKWSIVLKEEKVLSYRAYISCFEYIGIDRNSVRQCHVPPPEMGAIVNLTLNNTIAVSNTLIPCLCRYHGHRISILINGIHPPSSGIPGIATPFAISKGIQIPLGGTDHISTKS